jgi:hypothetical protein
MLAKRNTFSQRGSEAAVKERAHRLERSSVNSGFPRPQDVGPTNVDAT